MKSSKIIFFQILFFSTSIFSFNFFPIKNNQGDFFWHLKIPKLSFSPFQIENRGRGVRVAILDTNFYESPKSCKNLQKKDFNLKEDCNLPKNLTQGEEFFVVSQTHDPSSKNFSGLKNESVFLNDFSKKNHGAYAVSLIRQIAPEVEIFSFPIFNDQAKTSKKNFLQGLQQALHEKVDILYLGLKMQNFDAKNAQDRKILKLLQQFDYVVAPSGNDGLSCSGIAFPAHSVFFSVGAFEKQNDQYLICDFSQFEEKKGPNFVMPGKNLHCYLYDEKNQNYRISSVSGTSMAAAMMVGYLANILSAGGLKLSTKQVHYLIQKNSKTLHKNQWKNKVTFGVINQDRSLFCLQKLLRLKMQMTKKKFDKNFKFLVDKIVEESEL